MDPLFIGGDEDDDDDDEEEEEEEIIELGDKVTEGISSVNDVVLVAAVNEYDEDGTGSSDSLLSFQRPDYSSTTTIDYQSD
ncbi:hypothetical protein DERP_005619 [Dermatophagoides pteronyssinus]|uniref:Uncharacterized protein n=1 Tax=Dermatophagoides pteronyssinus TaxID=6956 RepID=A0ABQ8J9J6_DERPT|nr:hypothetical protein DERP_005619 [Dermatophagoides pteronyssinus]